MLYKKKTSVDLRGRRGKVLIYDEIINNHPEDVLEILAHFVVVRAEFLFMEQGVEYQGYCHLFESVELGAETPEYDFHITRNWRGQVTLVEAIKRRY